MADCEYRVDGHVHFHPEAELGACLQAAAKNIGRRGALCLVETAGVNRFASLPATVDGWRIEPTEEPVSARAVRDADGTELVLLAGRQVVAGNGLEVLAIGTGQTFDDGGEIGMAIAAVRAAGALIVLPWGVGKWSGARGGIIDGLIETEAGSRDIFLADSGVRPGLMRRPARLARAEALGWRVLAGSDPLPAPGEQAAIGRFGFCLDQTPDRDRPFASLAAGLHAAERSPATFGALETPGRFLRLQLAMQMRKRFG